ncbi:hypothetical protein AVEN_168841-1, partial [Araneus ventricosus]
QRRQRQLHPCVGQFKAGDAKRRGARHQLQEGGPGRRPRTGRLHVQVDDGAQVHER